MPQRHNIVIRKADGGVDVYPMKQWLRDHLEHLPPGVDPTTSTSHQLRDILRTQGWVMKETPDEISLIPPDADGPEIEQVFPGSQSDEQPHERESEREISRQVRDALVRRLSTEYLVHIGKSILYKIEVNALGKVTPDSVDSPIRGQYAFQTDILIEKRTPSIPLVVIELKYGSFTTHDVITYSSKAARHKDIYPYLRYGFVVVGLDGLSRRFLTHNQGFDFAMALPDVASKEADLVSVIQRQIASAERLSGLMQSNRVKLSRYEEIVDIGD